MPKIYAATKQINLRLPTPMLQRIDEARGDIPRNVWIRRAIELALAEAAYGPGAICEIGRPTTR